MKEIPNVIFSQSSINFQPPSHRSESSSSSAPVSRENSSSPSASTISEETEISSVQSSSSPSSSSSANATFLAMNFIVLFILLLTTASFLLLVILFFNSLGKFSSSHVKMSLTPSHRRNRQFELLPSILAIVPFKFLAFHRIWKFCLLCLRYDPMHPSCGRLAAEHGSDSRSLQ